MFWTHFARFFDIGTKENQYIYLLSKMIFANEKIVRSERNWLKKQEIMKRKEERKNSNQFLEIENYKHKIYFVNREF